MNSETPKPWVWSDISAGDPRQFSNSAARNQAPIIETLSGLVTAIETGDRALELASGTGQHAVAFAQAFPATTWQPSDLDPRSLASIAAHRAAAALSNLEPPVRVDLMDNNWSDAIDDPFDLIFACNITHVAPFAVTEHIIKGAAQLLRAGGVLTVYGPFKRQGDWVSEGNQSFDHELKNTDPRWGIRDTAEIGALAGAHGLALDTVIAMPANNSMLILRRAGSHSASSTSADSLCSSK